MIKTQLRTSIPIVFLINNGNLLTKQVSDNSGENSVVKVTSSFAYDLANQCTSEIHNNGTSYNYSYVYTPDGNMTEKTVANKYKVKYTYDELNRLTSEEQLDYNNDSNEYVQNFKETYSFDDYNNITEKAHTEPDTSKNTTVVSTYDKTRLSTQTENGSEITYTYDDNGNMATKTAVNGELSAVTEFSYDAFDRTESITLGNGVTTSFAYNTDSDRISKTTGTKTTETVLDNGSISADLILGNNASITKVFSGDNSVYCENGVFTYNIINYNGDLVATAGSNDIDYKYNAYGTKISEPTTVTNPIGYRNYYYDTETGLYYLKARYYDSTTGQFTQEDTVHDDNLQYNLYGYCSGNPVLYTDPSGHDAILMLDSEGAGGFGDN